LEPSSGCRSVDPLGKRYQGDPERVKLLQQQYEVAEVPPEPVQPPANDHVELAAARVGEQLVETCATILRA